MAAVADALLALLLVATNCGLLDEIQPLLDHPDSINDFIDALEEYINNETYND